jgi:hypothetical protein
MRNTVLTTAGRGIPNFELVASAALGAFLPMECKILEVKRLLEALTGFLAYGDFSLSETLLRILGQIEPTSFRSVQFAINRLEVKFLLKNGDSITFQRVPPTGLANFFFWGVIVDLRWSGDRNLNMIKQASPDITWRSVEKAA